MYHHHVWGVSPVTTGLSVSYSEEGLGMLPFRPTAPKELSDGYQEAGELAYLRRDACDVTGDQKEARLWERLGDYCSQMANTRATDDDQYLFQRNQMRHNREVPMGKSDMDSYGISLLGNSESRHLPEWKWAAMELALQLLSPWQRVCFEMVVGGRMSPKDVAEATQQKEHDVYSAVNKAKSKLAKVQTKLMALWDENKPDLTQNGEEI